MAETIDLKTLGGRVAHLRLALAVPMGRPVSRDRLAQLVAEKLGESKPVHGTTVKGWEEGAEPSLKVIQALAEIATERGLPQFDAAWIAFGIITGEGPGPGPGRTLTRE